MRALAAALLVCAGVPAQRPPNIVLVLADDLGYGDPGAYKDESKFPTPHVDRLAAEGTRFTDAHSPSSVCTPTRYGILTGRYAWRTGLARGVLWAWDPPLIRDGEHTLPELLGAAGYRTACIGKWHLGWNWAIDGGRRVRDVCPGVWHRRRGRIQERIDFARAIEGGPLAHGFDSYFGDDVPNFPPYTWIEDDRVAVLPTAAKPDGMFGAPGPMAPGWDLAVVLPTLAQRAGAWIDEHARASTRTPFFLYLPLTAPHTPIAPTARWSGVSEAGAYGDFVAETDWVLGVVLESLARNGLDQDTLVVFTSDNGSPHRDGTDRSGPVGSVRRHGHDPSGGWRGLEGDIWEGGHRVPCLVRWPGRVPAGRVCSEPMVLTDLFRTLCALVPGVEVPEEAAGDSFDLADVWLGRRDAAAGPVRDHLVHHSFHGVFAIRSGTEKLILGRGSGGFTRSAMPDGAPAGQLYDLAEDPGETDDLYLERPDAVVRLRGLLDDLRPRGRSIGS